MENITKIKKENLNEVFFNSCRVSSNDDICCFTGIVIELFGNNEIKDILTITIKSDEEPEIDNIEIKSDRDIEKLKIRLLECLDELSLLDAEYFETYIYISKKNSGEVVTFYSSESFYDFLTKKEDKQELLTFLETLNKFSFLNNSRNIKLLNIFQDNEKKSIKVETKSLSIGLELSDKDIKQRIMRISEMSNCQTEINYVPEQFLVKFEKKSELSEIEQLLNKIVLLLSIKSISNFTKINENQLNFRIIGTKLIEGQFDFDNDQIYDDKRDIFEIYKWIYNSDNVDERLEISRNVLTLYYDGASLLNNTSMFLPAIKSNFEIYLKDNVDRYIDVLNNVVVLLKDMNKEVTNYSNELIIKFKTNFIGFSSFFVSTILFNVLSEQKLDNIFTKDITMITLAFLSISLLFLIFSIIELNTNKKRIEKNYTADKNYYTILLNKEDVTRIFNNDANFNDDIKYLKNQRNLVVGFWMLVILIVLIVVIFAGTLNDNGTLIYNDIYNKTKDFF